MGRKRKECVCSHVGSLLLRHSVPSFQPSESCRMLVQGALQKGYLNKRKGDINLFFTHFSNWSGDFYHPFPIDFFMVGGGKQRRVGRNWRTKSHLGSKLSCPFPLTYRSSFSKALFLFFMWVEMLLSLHSVQLMIWIETLVFPLLGFGSWHWKPSSFPPETSLCKSKALWLLGHFLC